MFYGKSWNDWIAQYELGHRNPVNRVCHTFGIPMIALAIVLAPGGYWSHSVLALAAALFVGGWILQFIGHVFEGKRPEFFNDWRFLFVGLRWWFAKVSGRV